MVAKSQCFILVCYLCSSKTETNGKGCSKDGLGTSPCSAARETAKGKLIVSLHGRRGLLRLGLCELVEKCTCKAVPMAHPLLIMIANVHLTIYLAPYWSGESCIPYQTKFVLNQTKLVRLHIHAAPVVAFYHRNLAFHYNSHAN
jgi:hypothetical protein